MPGHLACEKEFGYKAYRSAQELTAAYTRLIEEEVLPAVANGLSAAIYTQVSDIEEEINGLMTYDRAVLKPDEDVLRALNARLYAAYAAAVR